MGIDEEERARLKELHRAQLAAARLARLGREPRVVAVAAMPETPASGSPGPEPLPGADPRGGATEARLARLEERAKTENRRLLGAMLAAATAGALVAGIVFGPPSHESGARAHLDLESIAVDRLAVREAIRIVDERGREIAFLGREGGAAVSGLSGAPPVVLGLRSTPVEASEAGTQPAVRLAASPAGGAVSLQAPEGATTLQLVASDAGPEIRLVSGSEARVLTESATPAPR